MLSILCLSLWGVAAKGFSVGVFIGGLMMNSKHKYEREDVKEDWLKKWYENYLRNTKYPNLEKAEKDGQDAIAKASKRLGDALDILDDKQVADSITETIVDQIVTDYSVRFFRKFKIPSNPVGPNDNTDTAQLKLKAQFQQTIGTLTIKRGTFDAAKNSTIFTTYSGTPGSVWDEIADLANKRSRLQHAELTRIIMAVDPSIQANTFISTVTTGLNPVPSGDSTITTLRTAATALATALAPAPAPGGGGGGAPPAAAVTDPLKDAVNNAGNAVIDKWTIAQISTEISERFDAQAIKKIAQLDDPIEAARAAFNADEAKGPTADEYDPDGAGTALTAAELGKEKGEEGHWKTVEGEAKLKRIGLTYGFSVGYEKEMNKNHAFVGGNAFAKKDDLTIKYSLQVDKGGSAGRRFGELEAKPGYTFGVTVVAGKHLNPVFSVFGRGTFEFTKWGFTYDMSGDSPSITNEKLRTQKLGNWVKQAAVGVGARYNFAPLWSAEICYDFVPATKTIVRDFNKLGDDKRRRGYIYTASQHRAFLRVVRFFNM